MSFARAMNVSDLVSGLRDHHQRLPFEIGAFVALQTCEALVKRPSTIKAETVFIGETGAVTVQPAVGAASSADAAQSVVSLLAHLLVAAGPGVPPRLLGLVEGAGEAAGDIALLRDRLEAALVPLNRGASERVLSRLLREVRRPAMEGSPGHKVLGGRVVDAELDDLIGGGVAETDSDLDALLGASPASQGAVRPVTPPAQRVPPEPERLGAENSRARRSPSADPSVPVPIEGAWAETPDGRRVTAPPSGPLDIEESQARGARPWIWAIVFAVLIAALIFAVALLRPDAFARLEGKPPELELLDERAEGEARERAARLEEHQRKFGEVVLHVAPARAQVLLFVGRAPVEAKDLPMGRAHEFVAIADDGSVARGVVPATATWIEGRYELALQTAPPARSGDLGESRLPQDMGVAGALGTVRVVANPPGARVHTLVGFAPDVSIADVARDGSHEFLVSLPGYRTQRVVIGPSDWVEIEGRTKAEVTVELSRDERASPP